MFELTPGYFTNRRLFDMVENRTTHTLENAELNIFETHKRALDVNLQFKEPLLVSMIKGKKIMSIKEHDSFSFLPGESIVLPSNEPMHIDFPDASLASPTQCLALAISKEKVQKTVDYLNYDKSKISGEEWRNFDFNYRFTNDIAINQIIQRLIYVFTENHPSKDVFCELMLQELIIRILQFENKSRYQLQESANKSPFSFIFNYIRENITESLPIEKLSKLAQMSESQFYKAFKNETGLTPNEYIIEERLKLAENLLLNPDVSVKEAYLSSGFNSFSYFCRLFKKRKNLTPSAFKEQHHY